MVLIDGAVAGTYKVRLEDDDAVLQIAPFERVSTSDRASLEEEGMRLLAFAAAGASTHEVRVEVAPREQ
jgi:hypothetical protein